MLLRISVLDRLGLRQHLERETNIFCLVLICFSPALSPPLSLAWDKFTANHERCQIKLLWIEILQGWKEHCCSFLKQVLCLYSQANRRCKKDNSLKTWLVNSTEKDKWYLIFFLSWCRASNMPLVQSSYYNLPCPCKYFGFWSEASRHPQCPSWVPQSLWEWPVAWDGQSGRPAAPVWLILHKWVHNFSHDVVTHSYTTLGMKSIPV